MWVIAMGDTYGDDKLLFFLNNETRLHCALRGILFSSNFTSKSLNSETQIVHFAQQSNSICGNVLRYTCGLSSFNNSLFDNIDVHFTEKSIREVSKLY